MDAIKKKMQAMKGEKENAVERATEAEEQAKEANAKAEKVSLKYMMRTDARTENLFPFSSFFPSSSSGLLEAEEEVRALQKKIQQVENELDQVQENLGNANSKLDEKDKALQVVSVPQASSSSSSFLSQMPTTMVNEH